MSDDRRITVDGDKFIEIIDQMTVMAEKVKQAQVAIVRVTMLLYDLIEQPHPASLDEVAQALGEAQHGT